MDPICFFFVPEACGPGILEVWSQTAGELPQWRSTQRLDVAWVVYRK